MNTNKQRHTLKVRMINDELERTIEDMLTDEMVFVCFRDDDELVLEGTFTCQEIVAIAELLKKEGRV